MKKLIFLIALVLLSISFSDAQTTKLKGNLEVTGTTKLSDTVFLYYAKPSASGTRFPVITYPNGGLDTGVLRNASEQFRRKWPSLRKYLNDQKDGELAGYYTKDGKLVKNYGLKDNETGQSLGMEVFEIHQGHIERNYLYTMRRVVVDNIQWILIGLLVIGLGVQQAQIKKLRK